MVLASNEWLSDGENEEMSVTPSTSTTIDANSSARTTNTTVAASSTTLNPQASETTLAISIPTSASNNLASTTATTSDDTLAGSETLAFPGGNSSTSTATTDSSVTSSLSSSQTSGGINTLDSPQNITDNCNDVAYDSSADATIAEGDDDIAEQYQGLLDIIRTHNIHIISDDNTARENLLMAEAPAESNGLGFNENNNRHDSLNTAAHLLMVAGAGEHNSTDSSNSFPMHLNNSNTNTLQPSDGKEPTSSKRPTNKAIIQPQPLTQQALSSAVSAAQTNFFNSLGMELSAAATMAGLHNKALSALESQTLAMKCNTAIVTSQQKQQTADNEDQARIVLICEANSHPFQNRSISLTPNIQYKVGRLIAKSKACESNAIFDCKVLSRNHAVLWYTDDGKFWVKDTKSSNGTFINEQKLGNDASELHFGDIVKFGVDVLENSRKEVHGCIIACVKLYMPDGREAISIDNQASRSQYSGDRISYDELYRLNLYMQEATQREKVLKSKLFNIQNILDATRKNSAMCWQSLIAEDQLLHRIHSLERKLQIMDKNLPDSALRNEVIKLIEDKNAYQLTAKEALRKVYQERCDALQLLAKMESAYATSENECKILRDQIIITKQSLQDVNTRLINLECEYNEYREESMRQQQEAKAIEEKRMEELSLKLVEREKHCEELKRNISELLLKRADLLDEEEQAIEKLDAAIADMDMGDDEEDEEDEIEIRMDNVDRCHHGKRKNIINSCGSNVNGEGKDVNSSSGSSELEKSKSDEEAPKEVKQKVAKDSTIMKWLQNSDLNEREGSMDIFQAICNESDSSDEQESVLSGGCVSFEESPSSGAGTSVRRLTMKCEKFEKQMQNVLINLKELEVETHQQNNLKATTEQSCGDDSEIEKEDHEVQGKSNKDKRNYLLLKRSVSMLREAYKELKQIICANPISNETIASGNDDILVGKVSLSPKKPTMPPTTQTQLQNYAISSTNHSAVKKLESQETLKPYHGLNDLAEEYPKNEDEDYDDDVEDNISDATTRISASLRVKVTQNLTDNEHRRQCEREILTYKEKISEMSNKIEQIESDSQNTLEVMQTECNALRDKIKEMAKTMEKLRDEKICLEDKMDNCKKTVRFQDDLEGESNTDTDDCLNVKDLLLEKQMLEDVTYISQLQWHEDLKQINNLKVQHSEELITYREQLEQSINENQILRKEIAKLKNHTPNSTMELLYRVLPYGVAAMSILMYFLTTYY